jgi:hypothetical protein
MASLWHRSRIPALIGNEEMEIVMKKKEETMGEMSPHMLAIEIGMNARRAAAQAIAAMYTPEAQAALRRQTVDIVAAMSAAAYPAARVAASLARIASVAGASFSAERLRQDALRTFLACGGTLPKARPAAQHLDERGSS